MKCDRNSPMKLTLDHAISTNEFMDRKEKKSILASEVDGFPNYCVTTG